MASLSSFQIYQLNTNQVFVSNSNPCLIASNGRRRKTISYPNHTQIVTNPKQHMLIPLSPYKVQALDDGNQAVASQVCGEEEGPVLPLKVGILGFGKFGQFMAKGIQRQGHIVLATSRSDYSDYCSENGMRYFQSVEEMCEQQPDVILICSSILSTEDVVRAIPTNKLSPNTIFADVLSVKQFPRNLFMEVLPQEFGIVCTHPMFGPESGKHGWGKLPFVYDKVRINNEDQTRKCNQFLRIFESEGCRLVEMSCEEHDRHAAGSQFITHTIGRILSHLDLESTPINTKGYETLLQLTENTMSDSFDLYYGLFMYNVNATEQIENLDRAFETVKQKLFGRLHDILRKQIVERVPMNYTDKEKDLVARRTKPIPYFLPNSENMNDLSSFSAPSAPTPTASDHLKREESISSPTKHLTGRK